MLFKGNFNVLGIFQKYVCSKPIVPFFAVNTQSIPTTNVTNCQIDQTPLTTNARKKYNSCNTNYHENKIPVTLKTNNHSTRKSNLILIRTCKFWPLSHLQPIPKTTMNSAKTLSRFPAPCQARLRKALWPLCGSAGVVGHKRALRVYTLGGFE